VASRRTEGDAGRGHVACDPAVPRSRPRSQDAGAISRTHRPRHRLPRQTRRQRRQHREGRGNDVQPRPRGDDALPGLRSHAGSSPRGAGAGYSRLHHGGAARRRRLELPAHATWRRYVGPHHDYHATRLVHAAADVKAWSEWRASVADHLIEGQVKEGDDAGSWQAHERLDRAWFSSDPLASTSLAALTLAEPLDRTMLRAK
jgi:hypothetical protein